MHHSWHPARWAGIKSVVPLASPAQPEPTCCALSPALRPPGPQTVLPLAVCPLLLPADLQEIQAKMEAELSHSLAMCEAEILSFIAPLEQVGTAGGDGGGVHGSGASG